MVTPTEMPRRFSESLARFANKEVLELIAQQAFDRLSPRIADCLINLRDLVLNSRPLWGRSGHVSIADEMLPHRSPRTDRQEQSRIIEDLKSSFSGCLGSLQHLMTFVGQTDVEYLTDDAACKVALRSLWRSKRGGSDGVAGHQLAGYAAQLDDIVSILKMAKEIEARLRHNGILTNLGSLGVLMEASSPLENIAGDAHTLLHSHGGSDGQLAVALFEQFLGALLESVESESARGKSLLSRIRNCLEEH